MQKDTLFLSLIELGLTSLSANIYVSLTQEKSLTVTDLAKKYKVQRWKIYECLEELVKFGLAKELKKYSREITIFSPTVILPKLQQKELNLKEKITNLTDLIPTLMSDFDSNQNDFIKVYSSKIQLENLLETLLNEEEESFYGIGDYESWFNFLGEKFSYNWNQKRIQKNLKYKILGFPSYVINEAKSTNTQNLKQIKVLPGEFKSEGFILISKKFIVQWNPVSPKTIQTEDVVLSKLYKSLFEIIWKTI